MATAAAAVIQRKEFLSCIEFMCVSSLAHAVHGGFGEDLLQPVPVALEAIRHGQNFGAVGSVARRAEADHLEHLLDLALGERIAVGELFAHGLGAVAPAGRRTPAEQ